ncbi:MAG: hypothetical protein A3D74_05660 [Candidatus Levybacteria bacterium RIFCSPHIGHO2_02_FULL_37_13]|nr:MAG: hypothetical protein A3D74_05660 [Candidatus Levybacteria bacterium RIFCSPHIGHO2_02_FULL_37_13]OGH29105.1 MAG: hypothetical protein A3E40_03075 [Candidatus Levybacteria bacterium RIFCSPHIGHO2_12_FULL_37_9]OGH39776.1 MAG: hypothetical protein A3B41_03940 [Candidatus Levybacteria bacterium RIFCSPLOWO2_01_FULL_37_26]
MKEKVPNGNDQHQKFARLRRQVRAMQRQNLEPPQALLEQLVELDNRLTGSYPGWVTNFPSAKEVDNGAGKIHNMRVR